MKKAKLVIMLGMLSLVLGLMCVGVFASQSVSYELTGTITYKVENNIEATSNALNLSATANCSHVSATSGTGVTGSNISNYFKVIYNGAEQNQTQITSLISNGTLVVSATSGVTVSSGLVKMSNLTSSASTSQNLSLSLKFSDSSDVTKSGTGTITRTSAGTETKNVSSGNCITLGYSGDECCKNCGAVVTEGSSTSYGSHNYTTTKAYKAAANHVDGNYAQKTCSICNDVTGGGTITRLHASYEGYYSGKAATCTSAGWTSGSYCSQGCYDYSTTINALGHSFTTLVSSAKAATCTSGGTTAKYNCSRCTETSGGTSTSALGHNKSSSAVTSFATCTTNGYKTYKCTRCGTSLTELYQTATGHSYTITGYWCKTCYASCTVGTRGAICGTHGYVSIYTKKCSSCGVYA